MQTTAIRNTFKIVPAVYLLLIKEEKILLSKRTNTGYEDGNYGLVSGHVEANETLRAAIAREVTEEIGVILSTEKIELTLVMHRFAPTSNPPERLDFFMTVSSWEGKPVNMETHKCSDLNWFNLQELPVNTIPYIQYALEQVSAGSKYCEYGWPA